QITVACPDVRFPLRSRETDRVHLHDLPARAPLGTHDRRGRPFLRPVVELPVLRGPAPDADPAPGPPHRPARRAPVHAARDAPRPGSRSPPPPAAALRPWSARPSRRPPRGCRPSRATRSWASLAAGPWAWSTRPATPG